MGESWVRSLCIWGAREWDLRSVHLSTSSTTTTASHQPVPRQAGRSRAGVGGGGCERAPLRAGAQWAKLTRSLWAPLPFRAGAGFLALVPASREFLVAVRPPSEQPRPLPQPLCPRPVHLRACRAFSPRGARGGPNLPRLRLRVLENFRGGRESCSLLARRSAGAGLPRRGSTRVLSLPPARLPWLPPRAGWRALLAPPSEPERGGGGAVPGREGAPRLPGPLRGPGRAPPASRRPLLAPAALACAPPRRRSGCSPAPWPRLGARGDADGTTCSRARWSGDAAAARPRGARGLLTRAVPPWRGGRVPVQPGTPGTKGGRLSLGSARGAGWRKGWRTPQAPTRSFCQAISGFGATTQASFSLVFGVEGENSEEQLGFLGPW